jgi:hypothetical protein
MTTIDYYNYHHQHHHHHYHHHNHHQIFHKSKKNQNFQKIKFFKNLKLQKLYLIEKGILCVSIPHWIRPFPIWTLSCIILILFKQFQTKHGGIWKSRWSKCHKLKKTIQDLCWTNCQTCWHHWTFSGSSNFFLYIFCICRNDKNEEIFKILNIFKILLIKIWWS